MDSAGSLIETSQAQTLNLNLLSIVKYVFLPLFHLLQTYENHIVHCLFHLLSTPQLPRPVSSGVIELLNIVCRNYVTVWMTDNTYDSMTERSVFLTGVL